MEKITLNELKLQEWLNKTIGTQYRDIKGVSFLDGQESSGDLLELIKALGVDTNKYEVVAFNMYGLPTEKQGVSCIVYLLERAKLSEVNDDNFRDYIISEDFTVSYELFGAYIKRLSIGFLV